MLLSPTRFSFVYNTGDNHNHNHNQKRNKENRQTCQKMEFAEKMQRCHDYVEALEEERRKILVFKRELPLCLELVTQAIEASKREMSGTTTDYMQGQSDWSEQTSSEGPVLEEFIPIKRAHSCSDNEDENEDEDGNLEEPKSHSIRNKSSKDNNNNNNNSDTKKKSDWLRSVQLWSQSPDPSPKEDVAKKTAVRRNGGAFQPFQKEKSGSTGKSSGSNNNNNQTVGKTAASNVPASAASSSGGSSGGKKEEKEGQQRKLRRCWSPELHRRFLHALQQLGGSHTATPKQIRDLMKVDGLTNDEVKSHLQKYRLHTRRPTPAMHNNNNTQTPQFVVVGGIWMPPPEYVAVAATSAETGAANAIYAPVALPPSVTQLSTSVLQNQQSSRLGSEGRGSHSEGGGGRSNSPSTSSSTHTTTNSPNF